MEGISGDAIKVKTEWSADPSAKKPKEERFEGSKSIGHHLNEISGTGEKADDPYKVTKKKELDKEAFLKMFMTQLRYQDPTSPVDNEKMAQQMAMFSQLEQSVTTNQYLEKILAKSGDSSEMAFAMIGKNISANKAALSHSKLENTAFDIKLPSEASEMKVDILTEAGDVVQTIELGKRTEGNVQVRWDGKTSDGKLADSGRYFYKVNAIGNDGKEFTVEDKVEGRVTGVSRSNGETVLLVGDRKISMNEVNMIREPEPATAQGALNPEDKNKALNAPPQTVAPKDSPKVENLAGTKSESINIDKVFDDELTEKPQLNSVMPLFMR